MVKVVMVTADGNTVLLKFADFSVAYDVMKILSESAVGGWAFTVSFEKEEPVKSRFIDPKEGK